jgi:arylsulfatase A-like enzyme
MDGYFLLENSIDYLKEHLLKYPQPFLGYFHFLPPHKPYTPRREFTEMFVDDGFWLPEKPAFHFAKNKSNEKLLANRLEYDQNIAYVDSEFARLVEFMEESGLSENTILVFTSDHGEMFERGVIGHTTESLHEPVIRTPLLILDPDRETRKDVFTATSLVDLLPTLLHLTGQPIPDWIEGDILPPYHPSGGDPDRSIFSLDARDTGQTMPLSKASVAMVKGQYKLHAYFGYEGLASGETLYELYDLINDPEELNNLYTASGSISNDLVAELQEKINQVNKPYF